MVKGMRKQILLGSLDEQGPMTGRWAQDAQNASAMRQSKCGLRVSQLPDTLGIDGTAFCKRCSPVVMLLASSLSRRWL
jgi:hypothetical protein